MCLVLAWFSGLYDESIAALLSKDRRMGSRSGLNPNSALNRSRYTASLAASEAAMISDSHDDKAIVGCFFEPHEIAAFDIENTYPDVECLTAQSASDIPDRGSWSHS